MKETRSTLIRVRVSPAEERKLEQKALRADLSLSDLVRREMGLKVLRPPPARPTKLLEHLRKAEENPGATALERLGVKS